MISNNIKALYRAVLKFDHTLERLPCGPGIMWLDGYNDDILLDLSIRIRTKSNINLITDGYMSWV